MLIALGAVSSRRRLGTTAGSLRSNALVRERPAEPTTRLAPRRPAAEPRLEPRRHGQPVNVMVLGAFPPACMTTSFSLFDLAKAAAQAVNTAGGIQGLVRWRSWTCDDKFDPNATLDCARQARRRRVRLRSSPAWRSPATMSTTRATRGFPSSQLLAFSRLSSRTTSCSPITAGGAGLATAAIAEVLAQGVTKDQPGVRRELRRRQAGG